MVNFWSEVHAFEHSRLDREFAIRFSLEYNLPTPTMVRKIESLIQVSALYKCAPSPALMALRALERSLTMQKPVHKMGTSGSNYLPWQGAEPEQPRKFLLPARDQASRRESHHDQQNRTHQQITKIGGAFDKMLGKCRVGGERRGDDPHEPIAKRLCLDP